MSYRVITTVHTAGWLQYGRRMAASFVERWKGIPLTIYAEGFEPDIDGVDVEWLPDWQEQFKRKHLTIKDAIGLSDKIYNYRRDCVRFSHKVGAITDAAAKHDGRLIWLDADTYTHADVDEAWLDSLMPDGQYMAWLDRTDLYPECGFLIFDCRHPGHHELMRRFRSIYETGAVFSLPETHDSYVLEHVVVQAVAEGIIPEPHSLSADARKHHHVFVRSRLAERLDHLKGRRKGWGKSTAKDTGGLRPEAYWQ